MRVTNFSILSTCPFAFLGANFSAVTTIIFNCRPEMGVVE
jgi:hypothetical protein